MIQRQQSLWLLLAAVTGILSFIFPFATGGTNIVARNITTRNYTELTAGYDFFILILTGISVGLSVVTIFLFKNRKHQSILCMIGMVITLIILIIYFIKYNQLIKPTLALYCILPLAMIISYFMALKRIRNDEKLVKSLDKLR